MAHRAARSGVNAIVGAELFTLLFLTGNTLAQSVPCVVVSGYFTVSGAAPEALRGM